MSNMLIYPKIPEGEYNKGREAFWCKNCLPYMTITIS